MSVSSSVEVKSHMPNAKVLSEKQAIVAALAERIKNAGSGILVDYKGITVEEDTALRTEMRKESIEYTVVKNTLTRKALDSLGMEGLDHVLNGTTSLATTASDPIAPFRIVTDYSKKLGRPRSWRARSSVNRRSRRFPRCPARMRCMQRFWAP